MITNKQKTKLLNPTYIHDNIYMWCNKMAQQKDHSDQQITTIKQICAMTSGEQGKYVIIDDQLVETPTKHQKYRRNVAGDWCYQTEYLGKWHKLDK